VVQDRPPAPRAARRDGRRAGWAWFGARRRHLAGGASAAGVGASGAAGTARAPPGRSRGAPDRPSAPRAARHDGRRAGWAWFGARSSLWQTLAGEASAAGVGASGAAARAPPGRFRQGMARVPMRTRLHRSLLAQFSVECNRRAATPVAALLPQDGSGVAQATLRWVFHCRVNPISAYSSTLVRFVAALAVAPTVHAARRARVLPAGESAIRQCIRPVYGARPVCSMLAMLADVLFVFFVFWVWCVNVVRLYSLLFCKVQNG
jgi:hypothetical protein